MRLPNGFGGIAKLKGRRRKPYIIRKTVGWIYDAEKDKYKQDIVIVGYAETKKEAFEILVEYNKNNPVSSRTTINTCSSDCKDLTFEDVYNKWSERKFPTVSQSNVGGYKAVYKLCEKLYDKSFKDLKLIDLQAVVDSCNKNYPTLRKLKILFNQLYDYAMKNDICQKNYSEYIDVIQYKNKNPNKQSRDKFSDDEIKQIWALKEDRTCQTILMLIYTGCRIGELLNLKKENIHLEEQYFDVVASKTENGIRKVPIADKVLPFFKEWYDMNPKSDYLLSTAYGKPFRYDNYIVNYYNPTMKNLGINHTPHCCRHTCISLLASVKTEPTTIKKIVGHSGAMSLTEKVYTHLDIKVLIDAINKI